MTVKLGEIDVLLKSPHFVILTLMIPESVWLSLYVHQFRIFDQFCDFLRRKIIKNHEFQKYVMGKFS